ncbi:hypothetical protein SteCoe_10177 [Stentor coeruleus]|uniref:PNPLA domain-containing protein n=1 Tax=Stentor coeruleus TaxID=5963 RepID=A0A1R2CGF3_9CILI|nr:hypothetical protein SteCoe_10177 [Stentor coeruleus]
MLSLLLLIIAANGQTPKCRILALAGGSDHGAYQAGGIIGLINSLPQGEAEWDVITGIGIGALNGMMVSQSSKGSESVLASNLLDFWKTFNTDLFYNHWPGWLVQGLLFESGLYNTKPMEKFISSTLKQDFKRILGVGATDLITGGYMYFNSTTLPLDIMAVGILASAADQGDFPIVPYKNYKLISGAIKYTVDLLRGITTCVNMGFDPEDIIVDTVLAACKAIDNEDPKKFNAVQNIRRSLEIMASDEQLSAVEMAKSTNPNVNFRTVIYPTRKFKTSFNPYDVSKRERKEMLEIGQEDAKKAVSKIVG